MTRRLFVPRPRRQGETSRPFECEGRGPYEAGTKEAQGKAEAKTKASRLEGDLGVDVSRMEKELESKFGQGSEFAKQMERARREDLDAKFEAKFGSEFEKQMEKLR